MNIEQTILKWKKKNRGIIDSWKKHYIEKVFPDKFPLKKFNQLLENVSCAYCGITVTQIEDLAEKRQIRKKSLRGWSLEIDRLDSNLEYCPDNCVMACYWCCKDR